MDPISAKVGAGGLSNVAGELSKTSATPGKGSGAKFESVRATQQSGDNPLANVESRMRNLAQTGKLDSAAPARGMSMAERVAARDGIAFQPNLQFAQFGGAPAGTQNVWAPQVVAPTGASDQIAGAVQGLNNAQVRLESIIGELRSGKTFSQTELLGLQAEVNMLTEQTQMSTKLVDSAMQSLKSVMQQQA